LKFTRDCNISSQSSYSILWLRNVSFPLVAAVGLGGNLLVIASMIYQQMKSNFHQSLVALSFCDILFISVIIIDKNIDMAKDFTNLYHYIWHPMRTILISLEANLMMSISIERFLAVYKPIHYKTSSMSYSKTIHFCVFVLLPISLAVVVNLPKHFETEIIKVNVTNLYDETIEDYEIQLTNLRLNPDYIFYYTHWTRLISTGVIPMMFLSVVNILIFVVIRKQAQKRRVSTAGLDEIRTNISSAFGLCAIIILFIACNMPRLILNQAEWDLRSRLMEADICETIIQVNKLSLLTLFSRLCLIINSSANVLIYYSVSKLFRMKLRKIIKYVLKYCPLPAICEQHKYCENEEV
jgi:hypothetical protein